MAHLRGSYYTIYKYVLGGGGSVKPIDIAMPIGARILKVQMQGEKITLWAAVDTAVKDMNYRFWVLGTGWTVPKGIALNHLNTVIDPFDYVWHIFEEVRV